MAKSAQWYLNAARRTVVTALPWLARPDDAWAAAHLSQAELNLFMQLPPQERAHGIQVARRLLTLDKDARPQLVQAALLHDVGKLGTPQFVVWRVLTHLLPEGEFQPQPRLSGLAGARQARQHHAAYGADLITAAGGSDELAQMVLNHHNPGTDPELVLLKKADERT